MATKCGLTSPSGAKCIMTIPGHVDCIDGNGGSWPNTANITRATATLNNGMDRRTPHQKKQDIKKAIRKMKPEERAGDIDFDGHRGGETYVAEFDFARLNKQQQRVYRAVVDGQWRTLSEIAAVTGDPEASISARLRDLRKPEFGALDVQRQRRGDPSDGVFEYRLGERALSD